MILQRVTEAAAMAIGASLLHGDRGRYPRPFLPALRDLIDLRIMTMLQPSLKPLHLMVRFSFGGDGSDSRQHNIKGQIIHEKPRMCHSRSAES